MTTIEDRLAAMARRLREDVEESVDADAALTRTLTAGRGRRPSRPRATLAIAAAAAAVVVLVAVAAALLGGDGDGQVVTGGDPDSTSPSVPEPTDPPESTGGAETGIAVEVLGEIPEAAVSGGEMLYAGVQDAVTDHWTLAGGPAPAPTVDFDRRAVFLVTASHPEGCPARLASLERDGDLVTVVFTGRGGDQECGTGFVDRTHAVAVERADLPGRFTLVLGASPDGSHPEQRLEVDLSENFASSSVPEEPRGRPVPAGPDLQAPEDGREITFDRVGDVRLGQALDPASVTPHAGGWSCGYWGPPEPTHDGDEPPSGLSTGQDPPTVISIMVRRNPAYRTASGVGVGTTLASLERVYGDDLVVDRVDGWENPTDGLLASYRDVAAVRNGDRAITFHLASDVVEAVKVSSADFWGDDEGCA